MLVARHGRIKQPGGTQLRYRQWSFGVVLPDETLREDDLDIQNDTVLYQVFSEETLQAAIRETLLAQGMEPATHERQPMDAAGSGKAARQSDDQTVEGAGSARRQGSGGSFWLSGAAARGRGNGPSAELDFGLLQKGPVVKRESGGDPARADDIAVMDFGWLPKAVAKREFDQTDQEGQPRKRHVVATTAAAFLMGVAVLSLVGAYHYQQHNGERSEPPADSSVNITGESIVFDGCGGHADALPGCNVRVSVAGDPTCPGPSQDPDSDAICPSAFTADGVPAPPPAQPLAPPPPGTAWTPLFRQTHPFYQPDTQWLNYNAIGYPDEDNFSLLDNLEGCRGSVVDGKFDLKIVWPLNTRAEGNSNAWRQSTNPVTSGSSGVVGYEALSISYSSFGGSAGFGGLERNRNPHNNSLLDGSINHDYWFYAIGSAVSFLRGMPGGHMDYGETQTELWAICATTFTPVAAAQQPLRATPTQQPLAPPPPGTAWTPLFRQTHPFYQPDTQWLNYNAIGYPDEDNFSLLDNLEGCRGSVVDGKFDLKIVWPLNTRAEGNSNAWRQSTNPVTSGSSGVVGYEALSISYSSFGGSAGFGGLERNLDAHSLLDGSINHDYWFYAIGSSEAFLGGVPGGHMDYGETQTELWAICPTAFTPVAALVPERL